MCGNEFTSAAGADSTGGRQETILTNSASDTAFDEISPLRQFRNALIVAQSVPVGPFLAADIFALMLEAGITLNPAVYSAGLVSSLLAYPFWVGSGISQNQKLSRKTPPDITFGLALNSSIPHRNNMETRIGWNMHFDYWWPLFQSNIYIRSGWNFSSNGFMLRNMLYRKITWLDWDYYGIADMRFSWNEFSSPVTLIYKYRKNNDLNIFAGCGVKTGIFFAEDVILENDRPLEAQDEVDIIRNFDLSPIINGSASYVILLGANLRNNYFEFHFEKEIKEENRNFDSYRLNDQLSFITFKYSRRLTFNSGF